MRRRNRFPCPRLALVLGGAIAATALSASEAQAEGRDRSGSPYRLRWEYDLPLVGLGAAGAMTIFTGQDKPACVPDCVPPGNMLGIDDASIGNYSPKAHSLANVVVMSLVLAPYVINAADSRFDGWIEDTFVSLQTILLTQAITQITKSAVSRPAPFTYDPRAAQDDLESPDAFRSFISGHTSTAFAAATSYAVTFWRRHPDSPWRFVVLGVGELLATSVALLKIEAGYHYATDVAAGALVGASMGVLVPTLHAEW